MTQFRWLRNVPWKKNSKKVPSTLFFRYVKERPNYVPRSETTKPRCISFFVPRGAAPERGGIKRRGGTLRPLGPIKFSHTSLTQLPNTLFWKLHLIWKSWTTSGKDSAWQPAARSLWSLSSGRRGFFGFSIPRSWVQCKLIWKEICVKSELTRHRLPQLWCVIARRTIRCELTVH